ncbi:cation-transporting ATPase [Leucobacter sp. USCH14]|uniref:cation-transporting ATPase n=1 Tax=Leucobacter sp. USCH14 TaxID=3024838 RepID=UPI0030A6626B
MSNMKKLFNLAKKAMDSRSTSESGSQHGGSTRGSTDWRSMVHKAADAVTGESREHSRDRGGHAPQYRGTPTPPPAHARQSSPAVSQQDRAAIARYNYLLETADPRQLEQVHAEAFAKLTPTQRALLQQDMNRDLSPSERPASAEPSDLARAATRSEVRNPGSLRRLLARSGGSGNRGALAAGAGAVGLLGLVAGGAIATSVGGSLLADAIGSGVDFDALAGGLDPEALMGDLAADDVLSGVGDAVPGVEDAISGAGDAASSTLDAAQGGLGSLGDAVSNFDLRGFFER